MNSLGDKKKMSYVLWTLLSFVAYIGGLITLVKVTPMLPSRSFDEGFFMGLAAVDIIGAVLAFGAVFVTFAVFTGTLAIRIFDFLLLVGILIIAIRLTFQSLRPRVTSGTFRVSRVLAGGYGLFLVLAAFFCITQLFVTK
jgi:predicted membrane-bound mannosyltransferase